MKTISILIFISILQYVSWDWYEIRSHILKNVKIIIFLTFFKYLEIIKYRCLIYSNSGPVLIFKRLLIG